MRKETREIVVKAMLEMSKQYGKEYFKHSNLEDILVDLGYKKHVSLGLRGKGIEERNFNTIYTKEDSDLVVVMVNAPFKGITKPILVDKDFYDNKLTDSNIFFVSSKKDRPSVKVNGHIYKLHQLVMDLPGSEVDVDHVNHCHSSCLRSDLRLATRVENNENKIYRSHFEKNRRVFNTRIVIDTYEKERMLAKYIDKGFDYRLVDTNVIILKSPEYASNKEMYADVNRVEKEFFGEFAYNPVFDYEHPVSTDLYIRYRLGLIDKEELDSLQIEVVKQLRGQKALDYYQLAG